MSLFFQAEDGIRDVAVTGVQTCALPISGSKTIEVGNGGMVLDPMMMLLLNVAEFDADSVNTWRVPCNALATSAMLRLGSIATAMGRRSVAAIPAVPPALASNTLMVFEPALVTTAKPVS